MVALRLVGLKHSHQVAEALAPAQLPEHQCQKLVPAGEMLHVDIPVVLVDKPPELVVVKEIGKLCENEFVPVHLQSSCKDAKILVSNRRARK